MGASAAENVIASGRVLRLLFEFRVSEPPMIKNFHFKMLIGISIFAFVISFIYLSSGLRNNTDRVGIPIGGLFSAVGLFAGITAGAIRSISRRLDQAGIADDPQYPTSNVSTAKQKAEQSTADGLRGAGEVSSNGTP